MNSVSNTPEGSLPIRPLVPLRELAILLTGGVVGTAGEGAPGSVVRRSTDATGCAWADLKGLASAVASLPPPEMRRAH